MKLSIVVPVYNVEKYVDRCISSLLIQDTDNYEIIIVNDGSTDESPVIIRKYIGLKNVVIINQTNRGLSAARNTGIQNAHGKYIWFIDSDDWIEQNCLSEILYHLNNQDVLYFNAYYVEDNNPYVIKKNSYSESGIQLTLENYYYQAQFYIYRVGFLQEKKISFAEGMLHEDMLFTPIALYYACQITSFNTPVYHQFVRPGSITQSINPQRCVSLMYIIDMLIQFAERNFDYKYKWKWGQCISDSANGLLAHALLCNKDMQEKTRDYLIQHNEIIDFLCHSKKRPTKIMGILAKGTGISLFTIYNILSHIRYR